MQVLHLSFMAAVAVATILLIAVGTPQMKTAWPI